MIIDSKIRRLCHSFITNSLLHTFFVDIILLCLFIEGATQLMVEPAEIFFGNAVKVTCGPPPDGLRFVDWNAEWRRDGTLILEDSEHSFSGLTEENTHLLTVDNFFNTNTGEEIDLTS